MRALLDTRRAELLEGAKGAVAPLGGVVTATRNLQVVGRRGGRGGGRMRDRLFRGGHQGLTQSAGQAGSTGTGERRGHSLGSSRPHDVTEGHISGLLDDSPSCRGP